MKIQLGRGLASVKDLLYLFLCYRMYGAGTSGMGEPRKLGNKT